MCVYIYIYIYIYIKFSLDYIVHSGYYSIIRNYNKNFHKRLKFPFPYLIVSP